MTKIARGSILAASHDFVFIVGKVCLAPTNSMLVCGLPEDEVLKSG
jgi:hypothetical protein